MILYCLYKKYTGLINKWWAYEQRNVKMPKKKAFSKKIVEDIYISFK